MTRDSIAITVAAFLFACWFVAWLCSQLRPTPEPEQASEQGPDDDYYYRVTPERITTGAFARR